MLCASTQSRDRSHSYIHVTSTQDQLACTLIDQGKSWEPAPFLGLIRLCFDLVLSLVFVNVLHANGHWLPIISCLVSCLASYYVPLPSIAFYYLLVLHACNNPGLTPTFSFDKSHLDQPWTLTLAPTCVMKMTPCMRIAMICRSQFTAPFATHRKCQKLLSQNAMYNYSVADRTTYKYFEDC